MAIQKLNFSPTATSTSINVSIETMPFCRVTNLISTIPNATNAFNFKGSTTASNTPITTSNCAAGGGNGYINDTTLSAYKAIDMLDTSRAKGYFEYKMIVPTTGLADSYTVPVVMSAKTFGAGLDGAGGAAIVPVVTSGTINVESASLNIKAFLSAGFDSSTDTLNCNLLPRNLLPTSQPYNTAPNSYTGTETLPSSATIANQVCDWVLVQVRDTTTANSGACNILSSKAAVILSSGMIIDSINATTTNLAAIAANSNTAIKGVDISGLTASGNYKVTIKHRNHLGLSTSTPVTLTLGGFADVDFTTGTNIKGNTTNATTGVTTINATNLGVVRPANTAYDPTAVPGQVGSYIYGMRTGDVNSNGAVDASDRTELNASDEFDGTYDNNDLNLDGVIDAADRNISQNAVEAVERV